VLVENIGHARHLIVSHDEVEILVVTRLLADQRVHAPAPVQPAGNLALAQPLENLDDVGLAHPHAGNVAVGGYWSRRPSEWGRSAS
jgi:hypothetical protein